MRSRFYHGVPAGGALIQHDGRAPTKAVAALRTLLDHLRQFRYEFDRQDSVAEINERTWEALGVGKEVLKTRTRAS